MLADVSMFPQDFVVPVLLPQEPASPPYVLRPFGKSAGPEQVSVVQQMPIHAWQWVVPLLHDLAAQIDQKCRLTVERGEERITWGCSILVPDMDPEITMTHDVVPA